MNVLKTFASAEKNPNSDTRSIRKSFEYDGHGKRIQLSTEHLKTTAKSSVSISSVTEDIQIIHLVCQIEMIKEHFLEDIRNYTKASQIIKFAGIALYHYESSQFIA